MPILQRPQLSEAQNKALHAVMLAHPGAVMYGAWDIQELREDIWEVTGYAWADNPEHAGRVEVHCKVELWPDQWRVLNLLRMDGWETVWRKPSESKESLKGKKWWK